MRSVTTFLGIIIIALCSSGSANAASKLEMLALALKHCPHTIGNNTEMWACVAEQALKVENKNNNTTKDAPYLSGQKLKEGVCASYDQCLIAENESGFSEKLNAIPNDNAHLKTRGIIAASDFMIRNYKQCLHDNRCQQLVDQYTKKRNDTLVTCQKISSDVSACSVSPF